MRLSDYVVPSGLMHEVDFSPDLRFATVWAMISKPYRLFKDNKMQSFEGKFAHQVNLEGNKPETEKKLMLDI